MTHAIRSDARGLLVVGVLLIAALEDFVWHLTTEDTLAIIYVAFTLP